MILDSEKNPLEQVLLCKKKIVWQDKANAEEMGMMSLVAGSYFDDLGDYRPGRQVWRILGIKALPIKANLDQVRSAFCPMNCGAFWENVLCLSISRFLMAKSYK
jgi:PP-loop superfamily ATP-utilizing enzyme